MSFAVSPGETVAVIGPNGVGKSSLLAAVAQVIPFAGRVSLGGLSNDGNVTSGSAYRQYVGYVPPHPEFPGRLSVFEVLSYYGWLRKMSPIAARSRAVDILAMVRMQSEENLRASTLSTGMGKRLALGLAMMDAPSILVVDEVTSGVDEFHRPAMFDILKAAPIVLMATHSREEVTRLCTHVLVVNFGRLQQFSRLANDPREREGQVTDIFERL